MLQWLQSGDNWLGVLVVAIVSFLLNPLHYLATGLIIFDLIRNIRNERMWFGVRVTRIVRPLLLRYATACLVGVAATVILCGLGAAVTWQGVLFVTLLTIFLGAIRTRFAAAPFAISIALTLAWVARLMPAGGQHGPDAVVAFLQHFDVESWLLIGAVISLSEAVLQLWHHRDAKFPAYITSKRGRPIGALKLQLGFVMPIAVWSVPISHVQARFPHAFHPWLLQGHVPIGLIAFPVTFGIYGVFTALRPERITSQWRGMNIVQGALLVIAFVGVHFFHSDMFLVMAPIVCVLTEIMRVLWLHVEFSTEPLYASDSRGVTVLYTIHGSLSEKLGLMPGDIVTHVNQRPVFTEFDLHFAFDQNPAYAKFQILDTAGEVRFVGNPVFEGERHQLGLIVAAPAGQTTLTPKRPLGFLETLYMYREKNN